MRHSYVFPKEYEKTRELLKERKNENEERLEKVEKDLKRELGDAVFERFMPRRVLKASIAFI